MAQAQAHPQWKFWIAFIGDHFPSIFNCLAKDSNYDDLMDGSLKWALKIQAKIDGTIAIDNCDFDEIIILYLIKCGLYSSFQLVCIIKVWLRFLMQYFMAIVCVCVWQYTCMDQHCAERNSHIINLTNVLERVFSVLCTCTFRSYFLYHVVYCTIWHSRSTNTKYIQTSS